MKTAKFLTLVMVATVLASPGTVGGATPMGTAFTYQGQLKNDGAPVNDTCNFQFKLFDAAGPAATQIGPILGVLLQPVVNGLFTVQLDFGAGAFNGDARWLEVAVQGSSDPGSTTLSPRQLVTPAPYAIRAQSAADSALLAGYAPGNTAGKVPISNGTVNTSLNADKVDGQDAGAFAATSHTHTFLDAPGGVYPNVVEVDASGRVAIGDYPPVSSAKLYVSGGSLAQWDYGHVGGYGQTSVFSNSGNLDANGDFVISVNRDLWQPYFNDNFIFKVETFVCLDPTSEWPHDNKGSAYSMALVGKQRGASLVHFYEAITHANDATVTFSYSNNPAPDYLRITVNTNRASGKHWYAMVKVSH